MTTNDFTASNGVTVTIDDNGYLLATADEMCHATGGADLGVQALREYFTHERDRELGRWRDEHDPDMVVYPDVPYVTGIRRIAVVDERDMTAVYTFSEGSARAREGSRAAVARRYFAAHPEPREWEAAKPGEVWVIKLQGDAEGQPVGVFDFDGVPHFSVPGAEDFSTRYRRIESGYRIWPEETDDE